jgi:hypothetical protein
MDEFELPSADGLTEGDAGQTNGLGALDAMPSDPTDMNNALTDFNAKWEKELATKEQEEKAEIAKQEKEANKELEQWNAQRDIKLKAKKESNRSAEGLTKEKIEAEAHPEKNPWERVLSMVDAKDQVGGTEVTRMHSLFIQLKNDPLTSK